MAISETQKIEFFQKSTVNTLFTNFKAPKLHVTTQSICQTFPDVKKSILDYQIRPIEQKRCYVPVSASSDHCGIGQKFFFVFFSYYCFLRVKIIPNVGAPESKKELFFEIFFCPGPIATYPWIWRGRVKNFSVSVSFFVCFQA